MKKLIVATLVLFTTLSFAQVSCPQFFADGVVPNVPNTIVLCKKRYAIGFNPAKGTPVWVAEKMTAANVANADQPRKDNFRPDSAIPLNHQATVKAFIGTQFDKGHMAPFEDFADDAVAADESFFMTNMVPQVNKMNRGIWRSLEMRTRKQTAKGEIYVITSPIFKGTISTLKDGTPIPSSIAKLIFIPATQESFTVIMPNSAGLITAQLDKYLTTKQNFIAQSNLGAVIPKKITYSDKLSLK
jgi:endonuclease G